MTKSTKKTVKAVAIVGGLAAIGGIAYVYWKGTQASNIFDQYPQEADEFSYDEGPTSFRTASAPTSRSSLAGIW